MEKLTSNSHKGIMQSVGENSVKRMENNMGSIAAMEEFSPEKFK